MPSSMNAVSMRAGEELALESGVPVRLILTRIARIKPPFAGYYEAE